MANPQTGVSVVVVKDGEVLLVKRGKAPFQGYWSLPGGSQNFGESLPSAATRELFEETGLIAHSIEFSEFIEPVVHDENGNVTSHFVLGVFACREFSGNAKAADDACDLVWSGIDNLTSFLLTPGTAAVIARIIEHFDTQS